MKTAIVCGKWELEVLPGRALPVAGQDKRTLSYYEYLNDKPWETGRNAWCIEYLLSKLPEGMTLVEPFGGVGVFATVAQGILKPICHEIYELDQDCLTQLHHSFDGKAPRVIVRHCDAKLTVGDYRADMFLLDFPFFTVMRYEEWKGVWDKMTEAKPKFILWMDGASKYLHLHRNTYSKTFDESITDHESYIRAMKRKIFNAHGYSVFAVRWTQGCYYFLARKGMTVDLEISKETRQGGLVWK